MGSSLPRTASRGRKHDRSTLGAWPRVRRRRRPVDVSQMNTVLSRSAVRRRVRSPEKATDRTNREWPGSVWICSPDTAFQRRAVRSSPPASMYLPSGSMHCIDEAGPGKLRSSAPVPASQSLTVLPLVPSAPAPSGENIRGKYHIRMTYEFRNRRLRRQVPQLGCVVCAGREDMTGLRRGHGHNDGA